MKKKSGMLVVKRRSTPMMAAIVSYNDATGRKGAVLASEPLPVNFNNQDLLAAARRLIPQVPGYDVSLPVGIDVR